MTTRHLPFVFISCLHRRLSQLASLSSFLLLRPGRLQARLACSLWSLLFCLVLLTPTLPAYAVTQINLQGPPESGQFGTTVTALPNGNIVVTDPFFGKGAIEQTGAVYLYNGATGALISTLTGNAAGDQVGNGGVKVLKNGNYLVVSPYWHNSIGAVTWGNGATGVTGVVSSSNSLVGSTPGDHVGREDVITLDNDNYLVVSQFWHNFTGAVTWGNGAIGASGVVSSTNSLVGGTPGDGVGVVIVLSNDNYLTVSPHWQNNGAADVGQ